jgi:hypothetical protein
MKIRWPQIHLKPFKAALVVLTVQLLFSAQTVFAQQSCKFLLERIHNSQTQEWAADDEVDKDALKVTPFPELSPEKRAEALREIENDAIGALEKMVKPNAEITADVQTWFQRIEVRSEQGKNLTVMEHSALTYLLDRKIFDFFPDPSLKAHIELTLTNSWKFKTGMNLRPAELIQPLPDSFTSKMTREESLYNQVIFEADGKFAKAQPLKKRHLATAAVLLGFAFSRTGGDVVSGTILGYFGATMTEHLIHKFGGHAGSRIKSITARIPWLGKFIKDTHFGHAIVHHGLTFKRKYTEQFANKETEATLTEQLFEKFGLTQKDVEATVKSKFGVSLTTLGVIQGLGFTAPAYMAVAHLMGFGPIATMSMIAPTAAYIALSHSIHPYMHMSREEVVKNAPRFVRWIMTSKYGEWVNRHHWIHHKGGGGNYNLLHIGGVGGDSLNGELRNPTLEQVLEMRRLDLIGAN